MGTIRIFMRPIAYFYFGFRYKRFKNHKQPYFIMHNHQTVWDQFLIGLIWSNKTYFIMSDDLTTIKFLSPIMKFLVHPIPYKKASTDFTILRTCKQVVQEGGSIVIAAEGNRTYSGKTEYINPTIVKMIKFLQIPIATIRIEGGYGIFLDGLIKKEKDVFMVVSIRHITMKIIRIYQMKNYMQCYVKIYMWMSQPKKVLIHPRIVLNI